VPIFSSVLPVEGLFETMKKAYPKLASLFVFLGIVMAGQGLARSQHLPLPPDMQKRVDQAIDDGVKFLQATQGPVGTWAPAKSHMAGYAALPGLTLLECGVSGLDASVLRAAAFVRWSAPKMDRTYELALSILFLDKLGDPRDRPLIQALSLRLIAGQTTTGGWSYKCPILKGKDPADLFALLKKLPPPQLFDPLANKIAGNPFVQGIPGSLDPNLTKGDPLAFLNPIEKPKKTPNSSDNPMSISSPGPSPGEPKLIPGVWDLGSEVRSQGPENSRKWPLCIKMLDGPVFDAKEEKPKPAKRQKPVTIPRQFAVFPVVHDLWRLPLVEPPKRDQEPIFGTTDNSNSQFAILALWAARKYDVPMIRTLNLISRRYHTSQNADGTWGYRYKFGGGEGGSTAMTCVGLLGLAAAHGLINEGGGPKQIMDPRVIQGFLALNQHIGTPTGNWQERPMANLYNLWSIERVGVLYNLPTIAKKDWYRWGAEILVANQKQHGNWDKGGYHGASPVLDTCLALLFLKRANLAADLGAKLPFNPDDLSRAIIAKLPVLETPRVPQVDPKAEAKQGAPGMEAGVKLTNPLLSPGISKGNNLLPTDNPSPKQTASTSTAEEGGNHLLVWILAGAAVLLVLLGLLIWLLKKNKEEEDEADEEKKSKKKKEHSSRRKVKHVH
jgi:hypothetical protein